MFFFMIMAWQFVGFAGGFVVFLVLHNLYGMSVSFFYSIPFHISSVEQ